MPRRTPTTEPLVPYAWVGFAPPPPPHPAILLARQETHRLRATLAGDWRLLRLAWCALLTLFS